MWCLFTLPHPPGVMKSCKVSAGCGWIGKHIKELISLLYLWYVWRLMCGCGSLDCWVWKNLPKKQNHFHSSMLLYVMSFSNVQYMPPIRLENVIPPNCAPFCTRLLAVSLAANQILSLVCSSQWNSFTSGSAQPQQHQTSSKFVVVKWRTAADYFYPPTHSRIFICFLCINSYSFSMIV